MQLAWLAPYEAFSQALWKEGQTMRTTEILFWEIVPTFEINNRTTISKRITSLFRIQLSRATYITVSDRCKNRERIHRSYFTENIQRCTQSEFIFFMVALCFWDLKCAKWILRNGLCIVKHDFFQSCKQNKDYWSTLCKKILFQSFFFKLSCFIQCISCGFFVIIYKLDKQYLSE